MSETEKGAPYPEPTDPDKPRLDIEALAKFLDELPGIRVVTDGQRNELTNLWAGMVVFNLTTQKLELNRTGTAGDWVALFTSEAPLPVASGGTGRDVAPSLLVNLESTAATSPLLESPRPGVSGVLPPANGGTGGTLPVANGGTGATTPAGARNALGLGNTTGALPVGNGGTGAANAADARANLGITPANIGAAASGHGHALTDPNITGTLPVNQGGTGATTPAGARNALGLGNTTGALPVGNGGTGAANAADARANLGITPANIGAAASGHGHALTDPNITGTLPVNQGGTGATTPAGARNALGLGNTTGALPVGNGGTGATKPADARANLQITPDNIGAVASSDIILIDTGTVTIPNGEELLVTRPVDGNVAEWVVVGNFSNASVTVLPIRANGAVGMRLVNNSGASRGGTLLAILWKRL